MPKSKKGNQLEEKIELGGKKLDVTWETEQVQAESTTHLEADKGEGKEVILRFFTFQANPEAFREKMPTGQELFNTHLKQMEVALWQDGLVVDTRIEPRVLFAKDKSHYKFVIGCRLGRGQILSQTPMTLKELVK